MRTLKIILSVIFLTGISCCCAKDSLSAEGDKGSATVHLMVQGEPFLMLGAQLRTDYFIQLDGKTYDELEPYFELAANTNILVVSVPIAWRDIEKKEGEYNMELVYKYIEFCEKYDMKLELLWYGSYMCGYSVEGYLPDYIVGNTEKYPELNPSAAYQGWLGKQYYLNPGTHALVERESIAIGRMMQGIADYDKRNGGRHTVIGVQIENEPDMLATRHNDATGYSAEQIWPDLINMLDVLGQVVKNSEYECYTRVNQTTTYKDYNARSAEIAATEGIDYVGIDPYENTLYDIELKLRWLKNIPGNYSHIAENGGEFANNDILMLKALTLGCGYQIFEIVTTPHKYLEDWTLRGIYNPDFTQKPHTQRIIDIYKILRDGWVDLASAEPDDIRGFNLRSDDGETELSETRNISGGSVSWTTSERGIAYLVENDGYLTAGSTKADTMVFNGIAISEVEKGYYDIDRNWISSGREVIHGNMLEMEPCIVYRIRFS